MIALEDAAYLGKRLGSGVFGRALNHAAKYVAGCYFDLRGNTYITEGLTFEIPKKQTTRAMRGRFAANTYELPERELVRQHLPRQARVLELGGCIGVVSCLTNSLLEDSHAHVVVEANPFLIPFLERNRDLNGAHFSIEQCVISRSRDATVAVHPNMDSSTIRDGGVTVATKTFEQIETKYHCGFDALVMDIEGAESEFLRENMAILEQMQFVMVEFHPSLIGQTEVLSLREILAKGGLHKVGEKLTTEAYRR